MVFEVEIEETREKNTLKNIVFFACVFQSIWDGFGRGFGGVLGTFWQLEDTFANWLEHFWFLLTFWRDKLTKFARCGGLGALEECFGIHFGRYLA